MTTRTKSILIIAGTLLVGLLIGGLGTAAIIGSRVDELTRMQTPGRLPRMIEDVIRPTDEAQRGKITQALDSMDARMSRLRQYTFERHTAIFDSLRLELDSILTPEQQKRLEEWETSDRGPRGGPHRPGRGPHPSRGPRGERPGGPGPGPMPGGDGPGR